MVMVQFETWELVKIQELHLSSVKAWVLQPLLYPLPLRISASAFLILAAFASAVSASIYSLDAAGYDIYHKQWVSLFTLDHLIRRN